MTVKNQPYSPRPEKKPKSSTGGYKTPASSVIQKGLSPAAKKTLKELGWKPRRRPSYGWCSRKEEAKKDRSRKTTRGLLGSVEKKAGIMKRTRAKRKQRGRGVDIQKLLSKTGIEYHVPGYQYQVRSMYQTEETSGSRRSWEKPTGSYRQTSRHRLFPSKELTGQIESGC